MTALLLGTLLASAAPIYGDDFFTAWLNRSGYEVREQPCNAGAEEVRVAIFRSGGVQYNGEVKEPQEVAEIIEHDWLDIHGLCLYVEGPLSASSKDAFHQILSAAARHSLGVSRFADAKFTKRLFPKMPTIPTSK